MTSHHIRLLKRWNKHTHANTFLEKHTQKAHAPRERRKAKRQPPTSTRQESTKTTERDHQRQNHKPTQNNSRKLPLLPSPNAPPLNINTVRQRNHSNRQYKTNYRQASSHSIQTGKHDQGKTNIINDGIQYRVQHQHYFGTLKGCNPF